MSDYKLEPGEPVVDQCRRLIRRQLRSAGRALTQAEVTAQGIHRARRCLKRCRSIVILLRQTGEPNRWREEAGVLRSAADRLASARDVQAKLDALAKLESWVEDPSLAPTFARLRRSIDVRRKSREQAIAGSTAHEIADELAGLTKCFTRKRLRRYEITDIVGGVARTYGSGRRLMRRAYQKDRDQDFHDWRKHVQRHWRHMQLMEAAWPDEISVRIKVAGELSQLLGDDHDLWMLLNYVGEAKVPLAMSKRRQITELAREMQTELRQRAHIVGQRLYAEKPRHLARRLLAYWMVAAEDAASRDTPEIVEEAATPIAAAVPAAGEAEAVAVT